MIAERTTGPDLIVRCYDHVAITDMILLDNAENKSETR